MESESFTVDMEPHFYHGNKDITHNSRINMERSLSRKVSQVSGETKMKSNSLMNDGDRDSIPTHNKEKLKVVNHNPDHIHDPQLHHHITIMTTANTTTTTTNTTTTTTKSVGTPIKSSIFWKKSSSFKQSSMINPRRILFFFATLSTMGTILLICLTLSMAKYNEDDNSHTSNLT
ncbi:hypothetical protein LXL04_010095 [Taraxacum kok-saghyz]